MIDWELVILEKLSAFSTTFYGLFGPVVNTELRNAHGAALQALADRGDILVEDTVGEKVYAITDLGRRELELRKNPALAAAKLEAHGLLHPEPRRGTLADVAAVLKPSKKNYWVGSDPSSPSPASGEPLVHDEAHHGGPAAAFEVGTAAGSVGLRRFDEIINDHIGRTAELLGVPASLLEEPKPGAVIKLEAPEGVDLRDVLASAGLAPKKPEGADLRALLREALPWLEAFADAPDLIRAVRKEVDR